ncbi:MAG: hypothetical protein KDJ65_29690 [Anaerolineae bacterium]|nr:hypothetical protein [Anaerolineae bacterium]
MTIADTQVPPFRVYVLGILAQLLLWQNNLTEAEAIGSGPVCGLYYLALAGLKPIPPRPRLCANNPRKLLNTWLAMWIMQNYGFHLWRCRTFGPC